MTLALCAARRTLQSLGLAKAAHTIVGDVFRKGLSAGQLRRLSLGVELVKQPAVLVLDEPTSGLDSAAAWGVMSQIANLAAKGHTIVTTIHQPSSEVWACFGEFLLLSAGRTMFYGPKVEAIPYFKALGHPCPEVIT